MLSSVECEVNWDREIGAIVRELLNKKGPAVIFENITGYRNKWCRKLFTNGLGSREKVALAFYGRALANYKLGWLTEPQPVKDFFYARADQLHKELTGGE